MMRSNILNWMARAAQACGRSSFIPFMLAGGRRGVDIGDSIAHSARFRASASAFMFHTQAATDGQIINLSFWLKRGALGARQVLFSGGNPSGTYSNSLEFGAGDTLELYATGVGNALDILTIPVFRDPAAFGHLFIAIDTTQATAANRVRLFWNNVQITGLTTASYPAQGTNMSGFLTGEIVQLGRRVDNSFPWDGLIARAECVTGAVKTPLDFGRISSDTGAWVNKNYTGSFGTNGFSLCFASISTASDFGIDSSGNGHTFTVSNMSATAGRTYDWLTDTPTNNFCTLNPLDANAAGITLSATNLDCAPVGNAAYSSRSSFFVSSGKWYWEVVPSASSAGVISGVMSASSATVSAYPGSDSLSWGSNFATGQKYNGGVLTAHGSAIASTDVWQCALDMDNGKIYFGKNGTWFASGDPAAGTGPAFTGIVAPVSPATGVNTSPAAATASHNFGQRPFSFAPPTGFKSLCTINLPTPSIIKSNTKFDINLRTGTGAAFSVTGKAFSPKLVWCKDRTATVAHGWYDSKRGVQKEFDLNNAGSAESTQAGGVTTFNADGFSGGSRANINANGDAFIDYLFDIVPGAFDIQLFTQASSANQANSHSLGITPDCIIYKDRNSAAHWIGMHKGQNMTSFYFTWDQQTIGSLSISVTAPSSTQFFSSGNMALAGNSAVAYLFASKKGFSFVGSYIGNGSVDGPCVILDFKPKWIVFRSLNSQPLDATIYNTASNSFNTADKFIYVDTSLQEQAAGVVTCDILSNGFKVRNGGSEMNTSGDKYMFIAFAECPFKYATAR